MNCVSFGTIGCVISELDYKLLESIEITFNNITVKITKLIIELYNKFYCKTIFDLQEYKIIKLKFIIQ